MPVVFGVAAFYVQLDDPYGVVGVWGRFCKAAEV